MGLRACIIVLLALAGSFRHAPVSHAQQAVTWTQTHGPTGGKVNALLVDNENPSIVYAGTDGGIYISRDGGATWQDSSTGLPGLPLVAALAIDHGKPQTLYAGTTNSGVYRSNNGGRSWARADTGLTRRQVSSIAVDPTNANVVYAGTDRLLFKSSDGGKLWLPSSDGLPEKSISSLAIHPRDSKTVYAGSAGGVYKSTNGGERWQSANTGVPEHLQIAALAIDPSAPDVIYAATEAGVYRSTDAASTWQAMTQGTGTYSVHAVAFDPNNTSALYAAVGTEGVWRTLDAGSSWEATGDIHELVSALAVNPVRSQVVYAGTGRGVLWTSNSGQSWESRNNGLINTDVIRLVAVAGSPGSLYASTGLDVHKTEDSGERWSRASTGLVHPNVWSLAVDPASPETVYAGTWDGEVYRSVDAADTWRLANGCLARDAAILALAPEPPESKEDAAILWAGTNGAGVFRSGDGGSTWMAVNAGLSDLRVQALALASGKVGTLYAGTGRGLCLLDLTNRSEDGSLLWKSAQGLPRDEVRSIAVHERLPAVAYCLTAAGAGQIFRSTDGGASWTALERSALPVNISIQALAMNSSLHSAAVLYAATDAGVYRSADAGTSWQPINTGLPARANVTALLFDPRHSYLFASVENKGVYRTSDSERSPFTWGLIGTVLLLAIAMAFGLFRTVQWHIRSSQRAQEAMFERNWPVWKAEIGRVLRNENEVGHKSVPSVPPPLRSRALQRFVEENEGENLVLHLNPPVLEPANSLQVWDFLRNWRAAQKRLDSTAAFRPVAARISAQLCQLLGFRLVDSRSYESLHGFAVRAPALRLRIPPVFPIVFVPHPELTELDISHVRDLMEILNISSYLAVLILPDDRTTGKGDHQARPRLGRVTGGTAEDLVVIGFGELHRIFLAKDPERTFLSIVFEQVDLNVVSPYITSGPVPENMFFGRDHELKTIMRTIADNSFAIVGGRKVGKTSVLTKLNRLFADSAERCPLYLDCQAVHDYTDFCHAIETVWRLPLGDCSPEGFMRLIARLKQERKGQLIVVLLDEVDALLRHDRANQERLFTAFRALAQQGQCRFVFCGERLLDSSLRDCNSAFFNFCTVIRLGFLNARDAGRIVLEPMQEMGIRLEDAVSLVQGIIDMSACHPNVVQYICQELVSVISQRGNRMVTLSDLTALGNSTGFREYLIAVTSGSSTPLERLITALLLDRAGLTVAELELALQTVGVRASPVTLETALDALVLGSVLARDEKEYRFASQSFASALRAAPDAAALVGRLVQQVHAEVLAT